MLVTCDKIEQFIENKQIRLLSFYFVLKSQYRNSCFYQYSANKITKDLNQTGIQICENTVRKYLGQLKSLGLIRKHENNLTITSSSYLIQGSKMFVTVKRDKYRTIEQTEAILISKLIQKINNQHIFTINKIGKEKYLSSKGLNPNELTDVQRKKALRFYKKGICHSVIGIRKLAEKLNLSISYLQNNIKLLIKLGVLEVKRHTYCFDKLPKFIKKQLNSNFDFKFCYSYTVDNRVHYYFGSEYLFK